MVVVSDINISLFATRPQYKSKRKTEQPLTTHKPVETAPVIKGYTNKAEYNEINWTGP